MWERPGRIELEAKSVGLVTPVETTRRRITSRIAYVGPASETPARPMGLSQLHPVIITRDAAPTIERTLTGLRDFPEIVIYDNGSTDNTIELCRGFANTKVVVGEFFGFGRTKNFAASLASGDWVLSIDADEYLSEELLRTMRTLDLTDPTMAYAVERRNLFMGKLVDHAGWGNQWLVRIFNRRWCRFTDAVVHEKVVVPKGCSTVRLSGPLWHQAVRDLDQVLQKISRYSELERLDGGRRRRPAHIVLGAQWAFFKSYVLKKGFLEGWRGVAIASLDAMGTFCKHMKRYADKAVASEIPRPPPE